MGTGGKNEDNCDKCNEFFHEFIFACGPLTVNCWNPVTHLS